MRLVYIRAMAAFAGAALAANATTANAGAFGLKERSARAQGLSFAGATAGSGGLSSMGFNPAAISMVPAGSGNAMMMGGLSLIYTDTEGRQTIGGVPVGTNQDIGGFAGLANQYIGYRLDDEFLIGLSIYTPFGLTTQYEGGSLAQFDALTSKLQTFVIAPTVGWQPIPELTLAVSMDILYSNVRLTNAAVQLDGDTMNAGFSIGALWDVTNSTTVGIAYQHGYELDINGLATVNGVGITAANAKGQLPATVSVGVTQDLTDSFRIMGEAQWQRWSSFDRLDIVAPAFGLVQADVQNYDDAFFFAGGAEYDVLNELTIRAGAAYDQTPTNSGITSGVFPPPVNPLATNRTARVPDEDRLWLSIGATYDVNDHMSLDVGYSYLMALEDPVVGIRNAPAGASITYDGTAHIFSIGGSIFFN